tara:strand:+ start:397 stop:948 length:552 start_codon:yes stop_codon:yes gene_type:complete
MASITQILGTDSLSSSRIVLNDNFQQINDELTSISNLLDVSTQTLTLTGSIGGSSLNINGILTADSTSVNVLKPITITSVLTLQGGLIYSVATGSVGIMPALYTKSTYVLDGTALTTTNVVVLGTEGQHVTFIAAGDVSIDATNVAGVLANFTIKDNGTLTLRRVGSSWYVISHANTDLVFVN